MKSSRITALMILALFFTVSFSSTASGLEFPFNNRGTTLRMPSTTFRDLKTRNLVFQQYDFSCGAAVISTLLTYYFGETVGEKQVISGLFKEVNMQKVLKRKAFSLLDMKRFARARGYKAVGYLMDFDFLAELKVPVIVPVVIRDYHHFVIVKGLVGDRVVVADPALGNYTMRVGRFLEIWHTKGKKGKGIGFILKKNKPTGPMAEEELRLRAKFMGHRDQGNMVQLALRPPTLIPGQLQTITGPMPVGGSALEFFGIQAPAPIPPSTERSSFLSAVPCFQGAGEKIVHTGLKSGFSEVGEGRVRKGFFLQIMVFQGNPFQLKAAEGVFI